MLDERTEHQPPDRAAEDSPDATAPAAEPANGSPPGTEGEERSVTTSPSVTAEPEDAGSAAAPAHAQAPIVSDPEAAQLAVAAASPAVTSAPEEATPDQTPTAPEEAAAATAGPAPAAGQSGSQPQGRRPPRPREPLPWPELRAAAGVVAQTSSIDDLKDLFRLLPNEVRDETVDGVREYRKGARRPVSAFAGKSLARAVHTARRARRRPESDAAVSEAIGQALAAEIIASLDVEIAAEVILPKRDLLEREARNARRRQRDEDLRSRDDRRRRAREEGAQQGGTFGTYSGAKIRGLDELAKLFDGKDAGER